jgi:hypothetical protein
MGHNNLTKGRMIIPPAKCIAQSPIYFESVIKSGVTVNSIVYLISRPWASIIAGHGIPCADVPVFFVNYGQGALRVPKETHSHLLPFLLATSYLEEL